MSRPVAVFVATKMANNPNIWICVSLTLRFHNVCPARPGPLRSSTGGRTWITNSYWASLRAWRCAGHPTDSISLTSVEDAMPLNVQVKRQEAGTCPGPQSWNLNSDQSECTMSTRRNTVINLYVWYGMIFSIEYKQGTKSVAACNTLPLYKKTKVWNGRVCIRI